MNALDDQNLKPVFEAEDYAKAEALKRDEPALGGIDMAVIAHIARLVRKKDEGAQGAA